MLLKKTTPAPQNIVLTVINENKYLQAKFHARYVPCISSSCGIARLVTTFYARHVWTSMIMKHEMCVPTATIENESCEKAV